MNGSLSVGEEASYTSTPYTIKMYISGVQV